MDYQQQVVLKDLGHLNQIYVVPLADIHEGCVHGDSEAVDGYINWIAQHDNAYTILNGDLMNCATKDSAPDLFEDLITPDQAYDRLLKRLYPIRDRILMITRGGHEGEIFRKTGTDYMARLSHALRPDGVPETESKLDVPYKPEGGMLGVRLGLHDHSVMVWFYATHGWGGARTIGAKMAKVEELANIANVDVIVLSHDHTQAIHRLNVIDPPRSRIQFTKPMNWNIQRKLLVNTGGFIKYDGYIQRKGYVPQDLGTPRIRIEVKEYKNGGNSLYRADLHASM